MPSVESSRMIEVDAQLQPQESEGKTLWTRHQSRLIHVLTWTILGSYPVYLALSPIYPTDDLLRHVVGYAWGYSLKGMFPLSSLPDYSLYPLFEWLAGCVTKATSPFVATKGIAVASCLMIVIAAHDAVAHRGRVCGARRDEVLLIALLFLTAQSTERAILGRPEGWLLIWSLWATTMGQSRFRMVVGATLGVAASLMYWLAPLVFPLILLSSMPWRRRVAIVVALIAFHMAFWAWWSNGDMWQWRAHVAEWTANRPVGVKEGISTIFLLWRPESLALWSLAIVGFMTGSRSPTAWGLHFVYLGTNMIRYGCTAFACVVEPMVRGLHAMKLSPLLVMSLTLGIWVWHTTNMFPRISAEGPLPRFTLPVGARVLTPFNAATFATLAANPGTVEVLPATEIGSSDAAVRELLYSLWTNEKGSLDCRNLAEVKVTHVIENHRRAMPPCLVLIEQQNSWRLWQMSPSNTFIQK